MGFNFGSRLRRLELRLREKLAAAAAAAEVGLMEGPELKANGTSKVKKSEEYQRLQAQFRRLTVLELVRVYANLKCRQGQRLAKWRREAALIGEVGMADRDKSFDECARHERDYRQSERWQRDNACNRAAC